MLETPAVEARLLCLEEAVVLFGFHEAAQEEADVLYKLSKVLNQLMRLDLP